MPALTPLDEALQQVLASPRRVTGMETVPLLSARGRILASDVVSALAVPAADNSAMDGYAVRAADAAAPLTIAQRIAAGARGQALSPGTAARIFTGAPIPPGADAVVMQEDCTVQGDTLQVNTTVTLGDHIRPRGQDIAEGATVLSAGRRLRAQDLGALASVGVSSVSVTRALKVAVFSTGDELREPGENLAHEGQLYNSNRYTLAGLLDGLGCEVVDGGIVPDDPVQTREALQAAAAMADLVVTSGGVSVGEEDHVKSQVERLGQLGLWKLAIKPGKPLAYGRIGDTPFFGLPGNPVSVFVTFVLVVRPWLLHQMGASELNAPSLQATAGFSVQRAGTRREYLRVVLDVEDGKVVARRFGNQSSGVLTSLSEANALAVIPIGQTVAEGDALEVLLLDTLTG